MDPKLKAIRKVGLRVIADTPLRPLQIAQYARIPRGKLGALLSWAKQEGMAIRKAGRWMATADGVEFANK